MVKPRTLFLQHEQRRNYWLESGYLDLYRPMVASGLLGEIRSYPYQRDIRWFRYWVWQQTNGSSDTWRIAHESLRDNLRQVLDEFRPDMVFYSRSWPEEAIGADLLSELKHAYRFKLVSVLYDYDEDNAPFMEDDRRTIEVSDLVAGCDSVLRVERIRNRRGPYAGWQNVEAVRYLPPVPDPAIFKPSPVRRHDVTVSGSLEGYRREVYAALVQAGLNVHRSGGMMPGESFLSPADYAREIAESRIVVNSQTNPARVQLKGRVLQTLSCGSLLLEQNSLEAVRFLGPIGGVLWLDLEDLIAKVRYWLDHEDEREALAREARERYLARHDGTKWTAAILQYAGVS